MHASRVRAREIGLTAANPTACWLPGFRVGARQQELASVTHEAMRFGAHVKCNLHACDPRWAATSSAWTHGWTISGEQRRVISDERRSATRRCLSAAAPAPTDQHRDWQALRHETVRIRIRHLRHLGASHAVCAGGLAPGERPIPVNGRSRDSVAPELARGRPAWATCCRRRCRGGRRPTRNAGCSIFFTQAGDLRQIAGPAPGKHVSLEAPLNPRAAVPPTTRTIRSRSDTSGCGWPPLLLRRGREPRATCRPVHWTSGSWLRHHVLHFRRLQPGTHQLPTSASFPCRAELAPNT